jgi:hypothetical protein
LFQPSEAAAFFQVDIGTLKGWAESGVFVAYLVTPNGQPRFSLPQLRSYCHADSFEPGKDDWHTVRFCELPVPPSDLIHGEEAARILGIGRNTLADWSFFQFFMPDLSTPGRRVWYSEARMRALDREKVRDFVKREREKYSRRAWMKNFRSPGYHATLLQLWSGEMADPIQTEMALIKRYACQPRLERIRRWEYAEMILRYYQLILKRYAQMNEPPPSLTETIEWIASAITIDRPFVAEVIEKGPGAYKRRRTFHDDTPKSEFEALVYLLEQSSPEALSQFKAHLKCKGW